MFWYVVAVEVEVVLGFADVGRVVELVEAWVSDVGVEGSVGGCKVLDSWMKDDSVLGGRMVCEW